MAKKNKKKRGGNFEQQGFKIIRMLALGSGAIDAALDPALASGSAKFRTAAKRYTGWNYDAHTFDWGSIADGYLPLIATKFVTHIIPKISGLIRRL